MATTLSLSSPLFLAAPARGNPPPPPPPPRTRLPSHRPSSCRNPFTVRAQEVKIGDQLQEGGENVFVGSKNRWKYSTFLNWELWWPQFPILVYFKETQTKSEGQIHFFPVIFNGRQLYDIMVERAGSSKTSGPK